MFRICNFFEETYFCYLHVYLLACFYEIHLRFLTSLISFHLDDCDKPYQYSTRQTDDGADMRFRNSPAARNPSRFASCFIMHYQISYQDWRKKKHFSCNRLIYPNVYSRFSNDVVCYLNENGIN